VEGRRFVIDNEEFVEENINNKVDASAAYTRYKYPIAPN